MAHIVTLCPSAKVPRFIKHMVSVIPYADAPEHRWEALAFGHLIFRNPLVTTLRLADDEFAHLCRGQR